MPEIRGGDTFLPHDVNLEHLLVVISDPESNPDDDIVWVNITTYRQDKDCACILEKGDHPYIRHRSVVRYEDSEPIPRGIFESLVGLGHLNPREPATPALLDRLRKGAERTRRLPEASRTILVGQGLIE